MIFRLTEKLTDDQHVIIHGLLSGCDTFWPQLKDCQTNCHCLLFSNGTAERKAGCTAAEGSQADGARRNGVAGNGRGTESHQETVALLSFGD